MLYGEMGIEPEHQHLIAAGKPLRDGAEHGDYPITNGSILILSVRLLGGSIAELEEGYQEYFYKQRNFPVNAPKQKVPCIVCMEPLSLKMTCKHAMCPTCLMKYICVDRSEV